MRFQDLSLGGGAQAVVPWNAERVLVPGPVLRIGWFQDRLAVTGSLRSTEEGHREASVSLSVADLNGLAYWLALWAVRP